MSVAEVERVTVDQRQDAKLIHTCVLHPRVADGPHGPGCVALCGWRPSNGVGRGNGANPRNHDSCVVCDELYDKKFGRRG